MTLARDDLDALARLAHLRLDPAQIDALQGELGPVLQWLATLQEVDVEGVPEYAARDPQATPLRPDEPGPALDPAAVLAGAPAVADGQVVVPRFHPGVEE
jgi:aspartyl-tRNA(Asn)/glutamyl-tRNA(Gln) amidotransferase subunit C